MDNTKIARIKMHESFMTSERLNQIIDRVNSMTPLYYSIQKLIENLKSAKDDYTLQIDQFITQYGEIIEKTPNIVELLNSFGDFQKEVYQNVFVGTTEEINDRPVEDGQWLIEKVGETEGIVYYDEGTTRRVIASGGSSMPIISIDPITKMWLIDGVDTEVSAASQIAGPSGANGLPGQPATFHQFVSIENLPTLLSEGSNAHFNKAFLDSEGYLYFPQATNNLALSPARPYYKTSFSIKGDKGDKGDQGLKGETGAGLVLKGFRNSWEALPITGQDGDGYVLRLKEEGGEFLNDTVGYLWVYDSNGTTVNGILRPFKFVGPIQGERGEGLQLRTDSGYIQYKYPSDTVWTNLIALSALTGQAATIQVGEVVTLTEDQVATITEGGTPQNKVLNFGLPKGKNIELRQGETHIQWAIDGTDVWSNLIPISDLLGPQGLAATVQVGTVVASEPGSAPQITEGGTPQEKILNFVLPRGIAGADGQEISLQVADGYIQWKLTNAALWTNLIALSAIKGDPGTAATISVGTVSASEPGSAPQVTEGGTANARVFNFVLPRDIQGPNGLAVSLQKTESHIQWRLGTGLWNNLVPLSEIKGDMGDSGPISIYYPGSGDSFVSGTNLKTYIQLNMSDFFLITITDHAFESNSYGTALLDGYTLVGTGRLTFIPFSWREGTTIKSGVLECSDGVFTFYPTTGTVVSTSKTFRFRIVRIDRLVSAEE